MLGHQLGLLLLTGSLVALIGLRQFFQAPLPDDAWNLLWFVLQVLPLALLLPGLLRFRQRPLVLLSLAGMLYFIQGVLVAVAPATRALGVGEIVAALLLVAAASFAARAARGAGRG